MTNWLMSVFYSVIARASGPWAWFTRSWSWLPAAWGFVAGIMVDRFRGWLTSQAVNLWNKLPPAAAIRRHRGQRIIRKLPPDGHLSIGSLQIPWIVAIAGPFADEDIHSRFDARPVPAPVDISAAIDRVRADMAYRASRAENTPSNEPGWKLEGFQPQSMRDPGSNTLSLRFRPTSRYEMIATELRIDTPLDPADPTSPTIRQRYAPKPDLRNAPVPEIATFWGVGLAVVTSDNLLALQRRGAHQEESPSTIWPSVAEGGSRSTDAAADGSPDHFQIAQRGAREELGVTLSRDQLKWLALGAAVNECAYALLGVARIDETSQRLSELRAQGRVAHAAESAELIWATFEPDAIVRALNELGTNVAPFAAASVIHALVDEFGWSECERALRKARFSVSNIHRRGHATPI